MLSDACAFIGLSVFYSSEFQGTQVKVNQEDIASYYHCGKSVD